MTSEHSFLDLQEPSHNSITNLYTFMAYYNLHQVEKKKSLVCTAVYTSTRYARTRTRTHTHIYVYIYMYIDIHTST
jgi:hypothetical protein